MTVSSGSGRSRSAADEGHKGLLFPYFVFPGHTSKKIKISMKRLAGCSTDFRRRNIFPAGRSPAATSRDRPRAFSKGVHRVLHALAVWGTLWAPGRRSLWESRWAIPELLDLTLGQWSSTIGVLDSNIPQVVRFRSCESQVDREFVFCYRLCRI